MAESNHDFLEEQRRAVERMQEMYLRQQINAESHPMPPAPDFVRINHEATSQNNTVKKPPKHSAEASEKGAPDNHTDFSQEHKSDSGAGRHSNILSGILGSLNSPSIGGFKLDKDITLILGIILILASEKADRKLLLALLYILM